MENCDTATMQDSSDDDIGEDDLDLLASLVAAEEEKENNPSENQEPITEEHPQKVPSPNPEPKPASENSQTNSDDELGSLEEMLSPQRRSFHSPHPSSGFKKNSPSIQSISKSQQQHSAASSGVDKDKLPPSSLRRTNLLSEDSPRSFEKSSAKTHRISSTEEALPIAEEETDVERQLRLMKEQIQLLEAQVNKQKQQKTPEPPKKGTSRLIDDDIFSSPPCKPSMTNTPSSSKSQRSSSSSKAIRSPSSSSSTVTREPWVRGQKPPATPPSCSKKAQKKEAEEALFGKDSDSDWSDLDGEKPDDLNKAGNEMNKLLKKKQRVAHPKREEPFKAVPEPAAPVIARPEKAREAPAWIKPSKASKEFQGSSSSNSIKGEVSEMLSGIRIIKPLLSHDQLRHRMETRAHIPLSTLHRRVNTTALDKDWVTVAVIVHKTEPKMSAKGKQYSTWTLSDLRDCERTVQFFLFGQTHQALWKTVMGSVVGILNPQIMSNADKYQKKEAESVSITCMDPKQVMLMGLSKDLGMCKGKTRAGNSCTNFINQGETEVCTYHLKQMYKKLGAKRSDLQSGYTGITPKSFEQKVFGKSNVSVHYGGQTYTSAPVADGKRKGNKSSVVSVQSLQQHASKLERTGIASTMQIHQLMPDDAKTLKELQQKAPPSTKQKVFHDLLTTPTVGALNFVKHVIKKETPSTETVTTEVQNRSIVSVTAKDLLKQHEAEMKEKRAAAKRPGPMLGRGFAPGGQVDLDAPSPARKTSNQLAQAKAKAILKLQNKGGVKKKDPNAVKNKQSSETKEKVRKRVEKQSTENESQSSEEEPPKKRSRLLGDLDLDDPNVQKVLKANSKHAGVLSKEEEERQEQYFSILEKKETLEEKMIGTKKIKVKAVSCKQCEYTSYSPAERCKTEKHDLTWHTANKQFFECFECKNRTTSLDKLPKEPCSKCGAFRWSKTGMMKEKKVPLAGEDLLLRGEERKHVNT